MTDTKISALASATANYLTPASLVPVTDSRSNTVGATFTQMKVALGATAVNVQAAPFNVVGDSVTDNAAGINAAIQFCYALGGGEVVFPCLPTGYSYGIASTITMLPGVTLRGEVKGVFPNVLEAAPSVTKVGVVIKATAVMAAMCTFVGSVVPESGRLTLRNVLLECNALAVAGVSWRKVSDFFLDDVQVHTATATPFLIGAYADTANGVFWGRLLRCYANGTGGATTLYTLCGTQMTMKDCLSDNGATAVSVVGGSSNVLIEGGRFENPTVKGIALGDFGAEQVVRNTTILLGAASAIAIDVGESQGTMMLDGVEIEGAGYASTIGVKLLNSGSGRGTHASNVRIFNIATGISSDSAQGFTWTGGTVEVITGGTCVSLTANAASHRFSNTALRGISGATGVVSLANLSTSLSNVFDAVAMSGTVSGTGSRASVVLPQSVGADRGDAGATLTVGTDATTQFWATVLTANRTVTLSTTGALKGDTFTIVRSGLGAFTLAVGALKTIPSATAARVDVLYNGSAWVLTGYQLL